MESDSDGASTNTDDMHIDLENMSAPNSPFLCPPQASVMSFAPGTQFTETEFPPLIASGKRKFAEQPFTSKVCPPTKLTLMSGEPLSWETLTGYDAVMQSLSLGKVAHIIQTDDDGSLVSFLASIVGLHPDLTLCLSRVFEADDQLIWSVPANVAAIILQQQPQYSLMIANISVTIAFTTYVPPLPQFTILPDTSSPINWDPVRAGFDIETPLMSVRVTNGAYLVKKGGQDFALSVLRAATRSEDSSLDFLDGTHLMTSSNDKDAYWRLPTTIANLVTAPLPKYNIKVDKVTKVFALVLEQNTSLDGLPRVPPPSVIAPTTSTAETATSVDTVVPAVVPDVRVQSYAQTAANRLTRAEYRQVTRSVDTSQVMDQFKDPLTVRCSPKRDKMIPGRATISREILMRDLSTTMPEAWKTILGVMYNPKDDILEIVFLSEEGKNTLLQKGLNTHGVHLTFRPDVETETFMTINWLHPNVPQQYIKAAFAPYGEVTFLKPAYDMKYGEKVSAGKWFARIIMKKPVPKFVQIMDKNTMIQYTGLEKYQEQVKELERKAVEIKKYENAKVVVDQLREEKDLKRADETTCRSFWHPDADAPDPESAGTEEERKRRTFIAKSKDAMEVISKGSTVIGEDTYRMHELEHSATVQQINEEGRHDFEAVEVTAPVLHALVEQCGVVECTNVFGEEERCTLKAAKLALEFGDSELYDEQAIEGLSEHVQPSAVKLWKDHKLHGTAPIEIFKDYAYKGGKAYYIKVYTEKLKKEKKEFHLAYKRKNKSKSFPT